MTGGFGQSIFDMYRLLLIGDLFDPAADVMYLD